MGHSDDLCSHPSMLEDPWVESEILAMTVKVQLMKVPDLSSVHSVISVYDSDREKRALWK
jgi:hypothetical protein